MNAAIRNTLVPLLALACLAALPAAAAERVLELEVDAGQLLRVSNLAGSVRIAPGGDTYRLRATVRADSDAIADAVRITRADDGGIATLTVEYPDKISTLRYEDEQFRRLDTRLEYEGRSIRVRSSDGEPLRVDLEILVPQDGRLDLRQGVGDLASTDVRGDMAINLNIGRMSITDGVGSVTANTGSGRVAVGNIRGDLSVRTGSGDMTIENVLGATSARTGSGDVSLRGVDGDLVVETGSGDVELRDVVGSLRARTGSGDVEIRDLSAGPALDIATGSGSVEAEGDLGALRDVVIRTGSGSVDLESSTPLSLRVRLSTGSGSIKADVPVLGNVESGRSKFNATVGAGEGEARISTGSGSIRLKAP